MTAIAHPGAKSFLRNVLTLFTGTFSAQALLIAILPILTRHYSAEQFGYYGAYSAVVGLLGLFINIRLDLAVISAPNDERAAAIAQVSIAGAAAIGAILSALLALTFAAWGSQGLWWVPFIPLAAAATAIFNTLSAWHNRLSRYKLIAGTRLVQSVLMVVLQCTFIWLVPFESGLIVGNLLAYLISATLWTVRTWLADSVGMPPLSRRGVIEILHGVKAFSAKVLAIDVLSQILYQLPLALFGYFISPAAMGYYTLTQRALGTPSGIIGGAISEVFRQRATELYHGERNCHALFVKSLKLLTLISSIGGLILFFLLPDIFSLFFGPQWRDAATFAQVLLPVYIVKFISHPLAYVILLANRLDFELKIHVVAILVLPIGMVMLGFSGTSAVGLLGFYTLVFVPFWLTYIYVSYRLTYGN